MILSKFSHLLNTLLLISFYQLGFNSKHSSLESIIKEWLLLTGNKLCFLHCFGRYCESNDQIRSLSLCPCKILLKNLNFQIYKVDFDSTLILSFCFSAVIFAPKYLGRSCFFLLRLKGRMCIKPASAHFLSGSKLAF